MSSVSFIGFRRDTIWSLRGPEAFQSVRRNGTKSVVSPIVMHLVEGSRPEPLTVGLIVTKQVGNAVVRNRIRRYIRCALQPVAPQLVGRKVVIRVLPEAATMSFESVRLAVVRGLASNQGHSFPKEPAVSRIDFPAEGR